MRKGDLNMRSNWRKQHKMMEHPDCGGHILDADSTWTPKTSRGKYCPEGKRKAEGKKLENLWTTCEDVYFAPDLQATSPITFVMILLVYLWNISVLLQIAKKLVIYKKLFHSK